MATFLLREWRSLKNEDGFKKKDNWLRESLRDVGLPLGFAERRYVFVQQSTLL
jgi:hypothetical protein